MRSEADEEATMSLFNQPSFHIFHGHMAVEVRGSKEVDKLIHDARNVGATQGNDIREVGLADKRGIIDTLQYFRHNRSIPGTMQGGCTPSFT